MATNKQWAELEVIKAIAYNKPTDVHVEDIYKMVLNAYEEITDNFIIGPSSFTKVKMVNILRRLLLHLPLSPIIESDFCEDDKFVSPRDGIKFETPCIRDYPVTKYEYEDGTIEYVDFRRVIGINTEYPEIEEPVNLVFMDWLSKNFPITLPYLPKFEKYRLYIQKFDYDCKEYERLIKVVTPEFEQITVNDMCSVRDYHGLAERIPKFDFLDAWQKSWALQYPSKFTEQKHLRILKEKVSENC